jgi:putative FmdB family regulatory protein
MREERPRGTGRAVKEKPMPVYEYLCDCCGPFTQMRPMAEYELPSECPDCASAAPRVILTPSRFSTLAADVRAAHAANERSANAPHSSSSLRQAHGPKCGCCTGRMVKKGKSGAKSFPTRRPWMISH